MKSLWKPVSILTVFLGTATLYNNCSQLTGVSSEMKFSYLAENQVFQDEVKDLDSGATWLDGESFDEGMSQLQQIDQGMSDSNDQGDSGSSGGNDNDGGQGNSSENGDDGESQGSENDQRDQGAVDKFDPNDQANIGVTVPEPTNPSDFGEGELSTPGVMARMRGCIQGNGDSGFQFLRDDLKTYSNCDICEVIDRVNGRCLIRVRLPDPPPRAITANGNRNSNSGSSEDSGDRGDPLIIDVGNSGEAKGFLDRLSLSSQDMGILFDIFGQRARPYAHKKFKISWTTNPRYMYVVLPDSRGRIMGVDQMFGDNTLGPDGKYSLDGFHALSKYDGKDARGLKILRPADGVIDKEDAIFKRLRLWADTNGNGQADPAELKTFEEMKLAMIDLRYDSSFYEKDVHGNEAIFKSIVQFENGELGMIFDLWFKAKDPSAVPQIRNRAPASVSRSGR